MNANETCVAALCPVQDVELQSIEGGVTSSEWAAVRPFYMVAAMLNPLLAPGFLVGDAIYP